MGYFMDDFKCLPKMKSGGPVGLYANIHAKRERIKQGSGEKMRKPGESGAPTKKAFVESAKTAKK
jgi:thioredoxin reductase